jgi:threonine dehydrogenase-like Zn-dependent dehydrogenase
MRGAVTQARSTMAVVDLPEPGPAEAGHLVVRPETVGLCGSDFHYFHGHMGSVRDDELYPRIQGHEISAIVEDVGADCPPGLTAGQRVAIWPVIACGTCYACRMGRGNTCERITLIGIHIDGALQERLSIPSSQALPVADLDPRLTAFVEPMSIAVRTIERGRITSADRVLVLGAGPIGQAVAIAALDRGADVLIVDRIAARLELGRASGADLEAVGPGDDLVERARDWGGGELPDVVVEATGAIEPMQAALDAVAQAGRVLVVGLSTREVPLRISALPFRELDLLGVSCCNRDDFAEAAALVSRRRGAVEPLISHEFGLEEAPAAIAFAIEHPAEVMKAMVHVG